MRKRYSDDRDVDESERKPRGTGTKPDSQPLCDAVLETLGYIQSEVHTAHREAVEIASRVFGDDDIGDEKADSDCFSKEAEIMLGLRDLLRDLREHRSLVTSLNRRL